MLRQYTSTRTLLLEHSSLLYVLLAQTLFRIATGDNWNGIMKDTLREECEDGDDCLRNCCVSPYFAPLFFVVFVLMAQFVLVNVVVAVLMKHLEESHKQVIIQVFNSFQSLKVLVSISIGRLTNEENSQETFSKKKRKAVKIKNRV